MITKHIVKSCCGSSGFIFEMDKPIKKNQMTLFQDNGYLIPEVYLNAGIAYIQKQFLIATGSFGSTKLSVRCNGGTCTELLNEFESLLEKAINL